MAIALDTSADLGNNGSSGNLTTSYTCTGSNLILFVWTADVVAATSNVSGVTYNGVAMTKIDGGQSSAGDRYATLWMLVGPATGAHNVVVTTSSGYVEALAASYTGAAQTGQPDGQVKNVTNGNPSNNTITSVADNCWHFAGWHRSGGAVLAAGTGTTARQGNGAGGNMIGDGNAAIHPAGSNTIQENGTSSSVNIGVTFAPFVAVAPPFINVRAPGASIAQINQIVGY